MGILHKINLFFSVFLYLYNKEPEV